MALPLSTATLIAGIVTAVGSTAVGVSAIVFAWRNVKVTLRQQRLIAADQRLWEAQRKVYQELAEWLAAHHLAGADDPFNQPNVLLPYTSDPGLELQAKARLFAVDPIVTALSRLRDDAIVEAKLSKIFKNAIEYGGMFEDYSLSKMMQWKHPNDAAKPAPIALPATLARVDVATRICRGHGRASGVTDGGCGACIAPGHQLVGAVEAGSSPSTRPTPGSGSKERSPSRADQPFELVPALKQLRMDLADRFIDPYQALVEQPEGIWAAHISGQVCLGHPRARHARRIATGADSSRRSRVGNVVGTGRG